MATKKRASSKQVKASKEQARAWLGTVLSPMAGALRTAEDIVAESGSWTFRAGPQDFEYFLPVERMLAPIFRPNFEQLARFHPGLRGAARKYDDALAQLRQRCRDAFTQLMHSSDFQHLSEGHEPRERKYFAEYVINGLRDLPHSYSYRDFWTTKGADFLKLREAPSVEAAFRERDKAGAEFQKQLSALTETVNKIQQELADGFGLPVVEPFGEASV